MRSFSIGIFVCLLILPAAALTWPQAKELAAKNNDQLAAAQKQLETASWQYRRAYSPFLPQLSASAALSESSSGTLGATSRSYSYGFSASQSLFQGFSNYYSLQAAFANYRYNEAALKNTTASVYYDLRGAFIDLLIARQTVVLQEQILKLRQDNEALIRLLYDSGKEDRGNHLQAKADVSDAAYNLRTAQRDLALVKLKLSQMLGATVDDPIGTTEATLAAKTDLDALTQTSPAYLMAKYQLEGAQADQRGTISEFLPSLSLSGSIRNSGNDWPPTTSSNSWSLNLSYSLFPGGSNIADALIAGSQLAKAAKDFSSSLKDLRYNLEAAYLELTNAVEAVGVRKELLQAAAERSKITRVKYINGLTNYDEWDRVENTYISAQRSLLNQQRAALLAEANYYKSYGGIIE
ncbi:MAG: TolC family protein [Candidatus Margulisiibacteriota bacterium]